MRKRASRSCRLPTRCSRSRHARAEETRTCLHPPRRPTRPRADGPAGRVAQAGPRRTKRALALAFTAAIAPTATAPAETAVPAVAAPVPAAPPEALPEMAPAMGAPPEALPAALALHRVARAVHRGARHHAMGRRKAASSHHGLHAPIRPPATSTGTGRLSWPRKQRRRSEPQAGHLGVRRVTRRGFELDLSVDLSVLTHTTRASIKCSPRMRIMLRFLREAPAYCGCPTFRTTSRASNQAVHDL